MVESVPREMRIIQEGFKGFSRGGFPVQDVRWLGEAPMDTSKLDADENVGRDGSEIPDWLQEIREVPLEE